MTDDGVEIQLVDQHGSTVVIDLPGDGGPWTIDLPDWTHVTIDDGDPDPILTAPEIFGADSDVWLDPISSVALDLGIAVGAGVLGWVAARRRSAAGVDDPESVDDRAVLRDAIDDMIDLLPSVALQERLDDALAEAGIQREAPAVGDEFDPTIHEAVGADPTDDLDRAMRISAVEHAGLVDRTRRIKLAKVKVHVVVDDGGTPEAS